MPAPLHCQLVNALLFTGCLSVFLDLDSAARYSFDGREAEAVRYSRSNKIHRLVRLAGQCSGRHRAMRHRVDHGAVRHRVEQNSDFDAVQKSNNLIFDTAMDTRHAYCNSIYNVNVLPVHVILYIDTHLHSYSEYALFLKQWSMGLRRVDASEYSEYVETESKKESRIYP
jgi:hypothetical protein